MSEIAVYVSKEDSSVSRRGVFTSAFTSGFGYDHKNRQKNNRYANYADHVVVEKIQPSKLAFVDVNAGIEGDSSEINSSGHWFG